MIINLIKSGEMYSLSLPYKVKGQYWVTDTDSKGRIRSLISIEAVNGHWVAKSNKLASVTDDSGVTIGSRIIEPAGMIHLQIAGESERVLLFADVADESRLSFRKIVVSKPAAFHIGRAPGNHFCFDNRFASGKHAVLNFNGHSWAIEDLGSTNGTYVNGRRVSSRMLLPGDLIYIMGLRIVVGSNYLAVNNPGGMLRITSDALAEYCPQAAASADAADLPEKEYFYRSPRFHREVEPAKISIDPPPQMEKPDTVPMALMLGPSITMGMTSVSTALLTVNNVLSSGGDIAQALPTMLMSVSMLAGTILWPILTKKYEGKQKIKLERRRQEKYLAYLEQVRDDIRRKCKEQGDIIKENLATPEECTSRITEQRANLWERDVLQKDFLQLRLGVGDVPLNAEVHYPEKHFTMDDDHLQDAMLSLGMEPKQISGVPIGVSFAQNNLVGIYGADQAVDTMLHSLVLQAVALHGYDCLKIMLITDSKTGEKWNFVRSMPHFWSDDKSVRFFAANADEVKELSTVMESRILSRSDSDNSSYTAFSPYYLIISTDTELSEKCESLQRLLKRKNNCGFTVIHTAPLLRQLPAETRLVISVGSDAGRVYSREDTSGQGISFVPDRLNPASLEQVAGSIANIELELDGQKYALPNMLTFLEMFGVGKIEHLNALTRWKENNPTKTLQTPIGVGTQGEAFYLDLHEKFHGPHGLVAGMTGSGKSEFVITYVLSLAVNYHPDEVAFILIDYKGGGLAGAFEDSERGVKLPHLAGTITNLDGASVKRSLISIQSELRRRQRIFNDARKIANEGTMDIYKYQQLYRDKVVSEPVPHLFIISDEFAELKAQQPEFMEQLISAARIGRSLGVHLILATQKPSGVVDDQIWSNSKFRVCLKVQEKADSQEMIKCPDAAELSQTGRFYLQVGFNELFALGQSAWCGAEYVPAETVEKPIDASIQVVDNLGRVMMQVKPEQKKLPKDQRIKQIVAIVKYLSDLAAEENVSTQPLWLDPIPGDICIADLEAKYGVSHGGFHLDPIVGEYDDPFNQKQSLLTVPFTADGNCLVYGAAGMGKSTFLTTLGYSLLRHHSPEEVNLYIMDFGSETLRTFEKAPHVGGVMVSGDEEKVVNFLRMLSSEVESRKSLFADFGGDHAGYCRRSGNSVPNIVVLLNNYAGFTEQFEDYQDTMNLLLRDGTKYGIYFAVTATNLNDVRYKMLQNFKTVLTMQLNDASDYAVVVGRTDGLVPSKHKGRGLIALDTVYEFQTAYAVRSADIQDELRGFCAELAANATVYARPVPVLPDAVDLSFVKPYLKDLSHVPVGVAKRALNVLGINLTNKVALPVAVQDLAEAVPFAAEFCRVMASIASTEVVDADKLLADTDLGLCRTVRGNYEAWVVSLYNEMVLRNNTYVDAGYDEAALASYEERVIILLNLNRLLPQLSLDGKDKLKTLLEYARSEFKLRFVVIDSTAGYNEYRFESWYKKQVTGTEGVWIGDGVAGQNVLNLTTTSLELHAQIGSAFGYIVRKGRPTLIKLLSKKQEEEEF